MDQRDGMLTMKQVQVQRVKRSHKPVPEPTPDQHRAEIAAARKAANRNR